MLAHRLREMRTCRRLTQQSVADFLALHRPSYSDIELEKRTLRFDELVRLAFFYDLSVQDLLGPDLCARFRIVRK